MSAEATPEVMQEQPKTPDANHAQLRRGFEQERAARLAAEQEIERLKQQKQPVREDDDSTDEPYVDQRRLKKELSRFEESFEKKVEQKAEKIARTMVEQERQASFLKSNPDFNQILSPELLQKFVEKHPEMAEPMLEMPDNFARQKLLYQNIKALGLHKPPVPEQTIQQKIDANRRTPGFQPSGGNSPPYVSQGDFSPAGQKAGYQKMQELLQRRRG